MAPTTRRNSALAQRIATLQLRLAPLVPMPAGPPHPAFPRTLMAFHLLTEAELDSIAHYYHQSTPGPWTTLYPACMNWDKDFLAARSPLPKGDGKRAAAAAAADTADDWLVELYESIGELQAAADGSDGGETATAKEKANSYARLTEQQRIRIKRRKVGKFIGLVGMETPGDEIAGRILVSLDRAVERGRQELRRNEELMMRRRKGW